MKFRIEKSAIVITPSVGSPKLADAIDSVKKQTYKNLRHLIVSDGKDVKVPFHSDIDYLQLPYNTGANGFNGQRIYASVPHLVNADYVFFLDEDNWYLSDHVETLVNTLEQGNDFAYSLRKVFDGNGNYVCDDNCESLGKWPIYFSHNNPQYLIDTSSYAFTKDFIKNTCHLWHSGAWGEDRRYLYAVMQHARFDTSGKHTLCYRTDGNPGSVKPNFFIEGNKVQEQYYKDGFPWLKT
jgi:glycosyltransferase involved in cell wall biosynthesis